MRAYEEIIDFIAAGTSPESVVDFQPSEDAKARVGELIAKEKVEALSSDEKSELDLFIRLEHIMRLAKAKARKLITV